MDGELTFSVGSQKQSHPLRVISASPYFLHSDISFPRLILFYFIKIFDGLLKTKSVFLSKTSLAILPSLLVFY